MKNVYDAADYDDVGKRTQRKAGGFKVKYKYSKELDQKFIDTINKKLESITFSLIKQNYIL